MPWQIVEDDARCPASEPWAVVKTVDGDLEGCHATQGDAQDQVAALNAAEGESKARPMSKRAAIPAHDTPVREGSGDCAGYRTRAPSDREVLRHVHAVARTGDDMDPDEKQSYDLPHHPPESGSAADLVCVRNALARLGQTEGLSDEERAGAERHLQNHLDAQENSARNLDPEAAAVEIDGEDVSLRDLAWAVDQARAAHRANIHHPLEDVEIRKSGKPGSLFNASGRASATGRWYELFPGVREQVAPGAFDEVLAGDPDVHALWDHDTRFVLARTHNGTLQLNASPRGLSYLANVADTSYARDLQHLLERGDIDQASFAFTVPDDGDLWEAREEAGQVIIHRTITRIDQLFDVTITAKGANPFTDSSVARSAVRAVLSDRSRTFAVRGVGATRVPSVPDQRDGGEAAASPQPPRLADEETGSDPVAVEKEKRLERLRAGVPVDGRNFKEQWRKVEKFRE